MSNNNLLHFSREMANLIRPKEILSIPVWAKQYLRLPTSSTSEGGPLDIQSRTPYMVQPLADFVDPDIRRIVLMTSTQIGKTQTILTAMLYQAYNNPGPQLLVLPTKTFVKEFNKKRIKPQIRHSPAIKDIFEDTKDKSTLITLLYKGGSLSLAGSGVATDLSSDAIRDLYLDEVDRYEDDAGGEGNPVTIARNRTATFSFNSNELMTSSPILDTGNIYANYLQGDQNKYHVPCIHCGAYQELIFEQLKWTKPDDTYYECKHCEGEIDYSHHNSMLQAGRWVSEHESTSKKITSYHVSVLLSPFYPWANTVADYLASRGDANKERTFLNGRIGWPYSEHEISQNHKELYNRREDYSLNDPMHNGVIVLVCAFDIQETWVKGIVYGVGIGFEMWCVDVIDIRGRFEHPDLQKQLAKAIEKTYITKDGRSLHIACTAIDVSYNTQTVYNWIKKERRYPDSKVKAVRGSAIKNNPKTITYPKPKSDKSIYTLDTDLFKENFYSRLRIERKKGKNPNYIHYGEMEAAEFMELCSESKIMTPNPRTRKPEYRWTITTPSGRNENLDTTVYVLALIYILYRKWGIDDFLEQKEFDLNQLQISKSDERKVGENIRIRSDKLNHFDNFGEAHNWDE